MLLCRTTGCEYACPGPASHIFRQRPRTGLSPDEKLAAEKDLAQYCKPVELYNIIQRRAIKNVKVHAVIVIPSFNIMWPCLLSSNHYLSLIWYTNNGSLNFAAPFYAKMPSLQYISEEKKKDWSLNKYFECFHPRHILFIFSWTSSQIIWYILSI